MRLLITCIASIILLTGCQKAPQELASAEPFSPVEGSVGFGAVPSSPGANGTVTWTASYVSNQGITRFQIQVQPTQDSSSDQSISFGKGSFLSVTGSQPSALLEALKPALEAKHLPQKVAHTAKLPFTYAILGTGMSRDKNGGFNLKPSGSWTAMKIFLTVPGKDEEAEVFLNLSASSKKGEFSIKDADYGDDILGQLARVF
jgi:hypothetical protein